MQQSTTPVPSAQKAGLAAAIITFNEADRIGDCVRALQFCDDIVVVDSHSTDGTREIAAQAGARVIERDWPGYRSQKEFALRAARCDWVLCVDADERVSPALRSQLEALRAAGFPRHAGWTVSRITWYFGRFLRHGHLYPDHILRLIDRRRGGWLGREIHEHTEVRGSVGKLTGHLEHHSYRSLTDQQLKLQRYAELMATESLARGRRTSLLEITLRPFWRFFSGYVLRLGCLDGWRGFLIASVEANYVRQKYLKLYLKQRGHES